MTPSAPNDDEPSADSPPVLHDAWYQSEEPTRIAMIAELQRIRRRVFARPIPAIAIAALITGFIVYKVATKPVTLEAEVVLALAEGTMANRENNLPVDQLREYVNTILLPDNKLTQLIERRNLFRLRKTLGTEFAIEQLRSSFTIQIWKNSFVYYDEDDSEARRSARIGITVTDTDPDHATELAHDLADIAIETATSQRQELATELSAQVAVLRDKVDDQLDDLTLQEAAKQAAINEAIESGRPDLSGVLRVDLAAIIHERQRAEERLGQIASSTDVIAGDIAAAGLDITLSVVDERRPDRPTRSGFVLVMIAAVVGAVSLVGAALVIGAFDSRVHDTDDVARLGLPVLGQIPRFAGDNVGSMVTRGAASARVPSFVRWRFHR